MDRVVVPSVADYMTPGPYMVGPYEPLPKAHELMREHGLRHLPVMDQGALVGILSDRDLNLVQTLAHARPEEGTVAASRASSP
jgi:acetoin utilization protein AcuB